jgi:hypothetical protein
VLSIPYPPDGWESRGTLLITVHFVPNGDSGPAPTAKEMAAVLWAEYRIAVLLAKCVDRAEGRANARGRLRPDLRDMAAAYEEALAQERRPLARGSPEEGQGTLAF